MIAGDRRSLWEVVSACWSRCCRCSMESAESRADGCHFGVFESNCPSRLRFWGKRLLSKSDEGLRSAPDLKNRAIQAM